MAEPIQYPRWRYHATKPDTLVQNEKEEKALGAGWTDNPGTARPNKTEPTPQDLIDAAKVAEQKAANDKAVADAKAAAEAKARNDAANAAAATRPPTPIK